MMNAIYSLQTEEKHLAGLSFIRKKIQINILDVQQWYAGLYMVVILPMTGNWR